jgi:molybdopterin synthase sulfur carrier subunit
MRITVKLFASFREGRFVAEEMEFPFAVRAGEIVDRLGIPEHEVTLIFINGRHGNVDSVLAEGDELALFPPVGGG